MNRAGDGAAMAPAVEFLAARFDVQAKQNGVKSEVISSSFRRLLAHVHEFREGIRVIRVPARQCRPVLDDIPRSP
jgi:hypothetical protein